MTAVPAGVCDALFQACLGRHSAIAELLLAKLPLVLLMLLIVCWPNVANQLSEGRFTGDVDGAELRADRSQLAESWRARGLAPLGDAAQREDDARPLRQHQAGYATVRTADGALLYA